jgi:predicted dehydrogenase
MAYLSIDYAAQKLEVWRLVNGAGSAPAIEGGEVPIVSEEPLRRELADFVGAVRTCRAPVVTGEDGRRALALATQIAGRIADATAR